MTIAPELSKISESSKPRPPLGTASPLWQALRAIIAKELRQNMIIIALVIGLEFLIAFFCQYFNNGSLLDMGNRYSNILLYGATAQGVTFCSIVAAFLIGIFQPFAERQFDVWAFLVHRPVRRSVLFLGRVIAGLILYGIATGLPILVMCIVAATPSGGEFFLWQYTLPSIADFFASIPFYFVGMLIAEREARLYGSRLLPLALAIGGFIASFTIYSFSFAVIQSLVIAGLLAVVCESSAISHGFTLSTPRRGKIALAFMLLSALSIITVTSGNTARATLRSRTDQSVWRFNSRNRASAGIENITEHVLLPDGMMALRISTYFYSHENEKPLSVKYTDLSGQPLTMVMSQQQADTDFANYIVTFNQNNWQLSPTRPVPFRELDGLAWQYSVSHSEPGISVNEEWYYVHSRGIFYLYERRQPAAGRMKTTFLGTFGANGFVAPGGNPVPFDGYFGGRIVHAEHRLYRIDFFNKNLRMVLQTPPDENILTYRYWILDRTPDADLAKASIWVTTNRRFLLISPDGTIQKTIPITHDLKTSQTSLMDTYEISGIRDGNIVITKAHWAVRYLVVHDVNGRFTPDPDSPDVWEFYDDAGHLLSTETFPKFQTITASATMPTSSNDQLPERLTRGIHRNEIREGVVLALANPLFALLPDVTLRPLYVGLRPAPTAYLPYDYTYPLWDIYGRWWIVLPMAGVLALCGIGGWLLAGLYRLQHRMGWGMLGLLCGPSGLLVLCATNTCPRRRRCVNCRKLRPLNESLCPHCKTPWPSPVPNAMEIFA